MNDHLEESRVFFFLLWLVVFFCIFFKLSESCAFVRPLWTRSFTSVLHFSTEINGHRLLRKLHRMNKPLLRSACQLTSNDYETFSFLIIVIRHRIHVRYMETDTDP